VTFARPEAFRREYESNLAQGGVFVATQESFELREKVRVRLVLRFCGREVELEGEVVHQVTREMAALGGTCGLAVSFDLPAREVRERFAPLLGAAVEPPSPPAGSRARAPRAPARVAARIQSAGGAEEALAGRTRDLSRSGVLVSVPGRGIPVGQPVRLTLAHPTSGESMDLEGTVVREVEGDQGVAALGIRFDPPDSERPAVERFVEGIQGVEHARRLGGIAGDLSELGVPRLLERFGTQAPAGTLVLRRGAEEALVSFEQGLLRGVQLGAATGMKALVRLVGWRDGSFEFHARVDPVETCEPPLPLEGAVADATLLHDEACRPERARPAPDAVPRLAPGAAAGAGAELGRLERAVLDLVQAGFPVRRILDVIPEPDPLILRALDALVCAGLVAL
jgi:Tfp pilus assembly protein PilZ